MAVRKTRARRELITRTARVWSRLTKKLEKGLNEIANSWIKELCEKEFPEKFTEILKNYLREALAYGYWLQWLYLSDLRGKKYQGKITLSEGDSVKDSVQKFMNTGEWNEVIPKDAVNWINNYVPKLSGNFSSDVLDKTRDVIKNSLQEGTTLQQREKELQKVLDVSKSRIENIARTEVTRAHNLGSLTAMKANEDVIGVEFSAVLDNRTTPMCSERHGLRMRLDDPRIPENTPPLHCRCRSMLLALTIYDYPDGLLTSHEFDDGISPGEQRPEDIEEVQKIFEVTAKQSIQVSGSPLNDFSLIQEKHTWNDDLTAVNPNFSTGKAEWTNNCQRCVVTYEARRRGYDVEVLPCILDKKDALVDLDINNGFLSAFVSPNIISCSGISAKSIENEIRKHMARFGDEARAFVIVNWRNNKDVSHVFIAEQHGMKTVFLDPQSNRSNVRQYFNKADINEKIYLIRVDNLEITNNIKLCCKNREVNKNGYNVTGSNKNRR